MAVLLLAVSAVAPSLLLMWFFYRRDAFPEPPRVLWTTFALGVVIVAPVLVVALPMAWLGEQVQSAALSAFILAFLSAAIPEEVFKFVVLWFYAARHHAFDEPMDGIVYGVAASLGFATLENVMYVSSGGLGVAVARAVMAVPAHAFFGAIMGYFVGLARTRSGLPRRRLLQGALVWPILLHGLYDYPLMVADALSASANAGVGLAFVPAAPLVVIVAWRWTVRLTRRLRAEQDRSAAAAVLSMPPARGARLVPWLMTIGGGLAVSVGGLMSLALLLAAFAADPEPMSTAELAIGWLVLGCMPLVLGAAFFVRGIAVLNRRDEPAAATAATVTTV